MKYTHIINDHPYYLQNALQCYPLLRHYKKAAKILSKQTSQSLMVCQDLIAQQNHYVSWSDMRQKIVKSIKHYIDNPVLPLYMHTPLNCFTLGKDMYGFDAVLSQFEAVKNITVINAPNTVQSLLQCVINQDLSLITSVVPQVSLDSYKVIEISTTHQNMNMHEVAFASQLEKIFGVQNINIKCSSDKAFRLVDFFNSKVCIIVHEPQLLNDIATWLLKRKSDKNITTTDCMVFNGAAPHMLIAQSRSFNTMIMQNMNHIVQENINNTATIILDASNKSMLQKHMNVQEVSVYTEHNQLIVHNAKMLSIK